MVNVNVQLPPVISAPFPQATESIQRENQLRPTIPKTEETHSYARLRENQDKEQVAHQSSQIVQKNSSESAQQQRSKGFSQRREHFFATKLKISEKEMQELPIESEQISDFKQVISVIQAKYKNSVSPIPEPEIDYKI